MAAGATVTATSSPSTGMHPIPAGYAAIGDLVWIDANDNGLQDASEKGVANVLVVLYDSLLNILDTKYTDDNGHYLFDSIRMPVSGQKTFITGFYNVPPNFIYARSVQDAAALQVNSKLDPSTGRTLPFVVQSGTLRNDIDAGIKSAPGMVLPMTVDQFQGSYANGFTQLVWTAFTQLNIDHFDIERSRDGADFRKIGTVNTFDNITNTINYSYSDLTAEKGSNYYRLAMIDKDGNYTYSKMITVTADIKGISVSVVYPNPFSKRVQVRVECINPELITIRVLDNSGTVVRTQLEHVTKGENNIVIQNVAELPGGVYFLEVIGDHRSMKTKLMKE
jgi:hypothetical protein